MIAAVLLLAAALLIGAMGRACREPDFTDDALDLEFIYRLRDVA